LCFPMMSSKLILILLSLLFVLLLVLCDHCILADGKASAKMSTGGESKQPGSSGKVKMSSHHRSMSGHHPAAHRPPHHAAAHKSHMSGKDPGPGISPFLSTASGNSSSSKSSSATSSSGFGLVFHNQEAADAPPAPKTPPVNYHPAKKGTKIADPYVKWVLEPLWGIPMDEYAYCGNVFWCSNKENIPYGIVYDAFAVKREMPPPMGHLPYDLFTVSLWNLELNQVNLTGDIPNSVGDAALMETFKCNGCGLVGSLPTEFGKLSRLSELSAAGNRLSGPIPAELAALPALVTIDFSDNQLRGEFPEHWVGPHFQKIRLGGNHLYGMLSTTFLERCTRSHVCQLTVNEKGDGSNCWLCPPDVAAFDHLRSRCALWCYPGCADVESIQ